MIRHDYRAYRLTPLSLLIGLFTLHTFWLVLLYRCARWLYKAGVPVLPGILRATGIVFFSADISPGAEIGPGFRIAHSVGIVIGGDAKVGKNFELFQNVTLGGRDRTTDGRTMPYIGDNVTIFAGAQVLGPVRVGDNSAIGANSVVTRDVPKDVVVAGVPARVIGAVTNPHSLRSLAAE